MQNLRASALVVLALATALASPPVHGAAPLLTERLVLNEVQPNPAGIDSGHEWVELFNPGSDPIVLDGWKLRDNDADPFVDGNQTLNGTVVPAFGFAVITIQHLRLANTGDDLDLVDPVGVVVDRLAYGPGGHPVPGSGKSLARALAGTGGDEEWHVEDAPTPGAPNDALYL